MASYTFNRGSKLMQDRTIDYIGGTVKLMLIGTASPYTPNKDDTSMTAAATSELAVTGYAGGFAGADRRTLASKTITDDQTNDRTVYDAADPAVWTLSAGGTVAGAIVYNHLTSDALSTPLFFLDFTDVPTNGSTFTLAFHADGIGYTQQ